MSEQGLLNVYARQSLFGFAALALHALHPDLEFHPHWLNRAVHLQLKRVETGDNTRLLLDVPESFHTLWLTGVARIAWSIGLQPSHRLLIVLGETDMAEEFCDDLIMLLSSPWYQQIFPDFQFNRHDEQEISTSGLGRIFITSVFGRLPIYRVGQITALNVVYRIGNFLEEDECENASWCINRIFPLLTPDPTASIIVYNLRRKLNDLNVQLIQDKTTCWEHLRITPMAFEDQDILIGNRDGGVIHHYPNGDSIPSDPNPDRGIREMELDALICAALFSNSDETLIAD